MYPIFSELIYVYFIYVDGNLIYIGRAGNPIKRIAAHRGGILKGIENYTAIVYGPYKKWDGHDIECNEIRKHKHLKDFLATTTRHGYTKEISVENNGSKTLLYFGKRGKVEKMVSEHPNK